LLWQQYTIYRGEMNSERHREAYNDNRGEGEADSATGAFVFPNKEARDATGVKQSAQADKIG
jgi:hypothetical protein